MKQDSSWRKILDKLLPDFLAFYFLEIHQAKDEELYEEIEQTSEEKQMSILAIAERKGLEKGLEKGREEGRLLVREMISDILEIKFGVAGLGLFGPVEQITDIEALRKIRVGLKQVQSVAEAETLIRAHAGF
jgi:hypothetical protein